MMKLHALPAPLSCLRVNADRAGVFTSVLCGVHCIATPPLLLLLPSFGKVWAHPASHWGMALVAVPLALLALKRGYKIHGSRRVFATGLLGVVLILAGAALPGLEKSSSSSVAGTHHLCNDACCPSVLTSESGEKSWNIPPASVVTTLGGLALILAHLANLRAGCTGCGLSGRA